MPCSITYSITNVNTDWCINPLLSPNHGGFLKIWGTPPNPRQERNLLHLYRLNSSERSVLNGRSVMNAVGSSSSVLPPARDMLTASTVGLSSARRPSSPENTMSSINSSISRPRNRRLAVASACFLGMMPCFSLRRFMASSAS